MLQSAIIIVHAGNASPSSKSTIASVTSVLAKVGSAYCLGRGNRQFNAEECEQYRRNYNQVDHSELKRDCNAA